MPNLPRNDMSATNSLHYELCKLGGKFLKSRKNAEPWRTPWKYVAVELVTLTAENPDVWATNGSDTVVIEVKTSHSDFLADQRKWHRSKEAELGGFQLGNYRYYLCPIGVIEVDELPENWGLLVWDGKKIQKVKQATRVKVDSSGEMKIMTSIMSRILRPQIFNFREKVELVIKK